MEKNQKETWDEVITYLPIIEKMASLYYISSFSYEDLYQEACIAVYESIPDYDSTRGCSISSFLISRIKYRFFDLFAANKFETSVPYGTCVQAHKLYRLQQKELVSTNQYLTISEASSKMKLPESTIKTLEDLNRRMLRLQSVPLPSFYVNDSIDDDSEEFPEVVSEKSMISDVDVEEEVLSKVMIGQILEETELLPEQKRNAILYHLGFITGKEETFRNITKITGNCHQNESKHYHTGIKSLQKKFLDK